MIAQVSIQDAENTKRQPSLASLQLPFQVSNPTSPQETPQNAPVSFQSALDPIAVDPLAQEAEQALPNPLAPSESPQGLAAIGPDNIVAPQTNPPDAPLSNLKAPAADVFTFNTESGGDTSEKPLPSNDQGGKSEIAGFSPIFDPKEYQILQNTPINQRKEVILAMLDQKTAPAQQWSQNPGIQGMLRDTIFHRGASGAQAIIGIALGGAPVSKSGKVTPQQIQALNTINPVEAVNRLAQARQIYENAFYPGRQNLAKGLSNRFNQANSYFASLAQQQNP